MEVKKIATLATMVKQSKSEVVKLQAFDSSYFGRKSHFQDDSTQII